MDEMKEIVNCPTCNEKEYFGMMHMLSGKIFCRRCIYEIWRKGSSNQWTPGEHDYVFPLYEDGKNYTEGG